mmetsp:Transcript_19581/g.31745  ORF Transcript_19581/g.31745 Transcript_19581/m.31745 type:complete len:87 (+) Transcript_19581:85-345(+)
MIQPHHLFHFQWIYQYLTCLLLGGGGGGTHHHHASSSHQSQRNPFLCFIFPMADELNGTNSTPLPTIKPSNEYLGCCAVSVNVLTP